MVVNYTLTTTLYYNLKALLSFFSTFGGLPPTEAITSLSPMISFIPCKLFGNGVFWTKVSDFPSEWF